MSEEMSSASQSSLGTMEGLRKYAPDEGWQDLSPSKETQKNNLHNAKEYDGFFDEDYDTVSSLSNEGQIPDDEDDFLDGDLSDLSSKSELQSLTRKVAQTNSLVDSALNDQNEPKKGQIASKKLDELGSSLNDLFSQLYSETKNSEVSPWEDVSEAFDELSSEIKKREILRKELRDTQTKIDNCRKELISTIENLAHDEQERLSRVRMRSRLATVMADKLLKKLK
jgi:hypothetical protein